MNESSIKVNKFKRVTDELDTLCVTLDQQHRMHRKVQFLLDVRGYFITNKIEGLYIEFGCYQGEMMYSAWRVLEKTACFHQYIGLDTFEGEPSLTNEERQHNPHTQEGEFTAYYEQTQDFLGQYLKNKVSLIRGDFREESVLMQLKINEPKVALAVIDCNLLSSIEASIDYVVPRLKPGAMLFVDDYFFNMHSGISNVDEYLKSAEDKYQGYFKEYKTYAPFARAFVYLK